MAKLDALHQLHDSTPSVRALFDSIRSDGVVEGRTTVDELTADGSLTRRSAINLLRELAELGCGEFKVGRKGHPSRLEWRGDPAELVADVLDADARELVTPSNGDVDEAQVDGADEVDAIDEVDEVDEVDEEPASDQLEVELELEPEPEPAIQASLDLGDEVAPPADKSGRRGRTKAKAKNPAAGAGELIEHVFVLRPDLRVRVELPADLGAREAEVLASWIGSLSFER